MTDALNKHTHPADTSGPQDLRTDGNPRSGTNERDMLDRGKDGGKDGPADETGIEQIKDLAKNAPSIDTDGELTVEEEPAVFEHYSLPYTAGVRRLARR